MDLVLHHLFSNHCYINSLVYFSTPIGEASFCSKWWLTERPTSDRCTEGWACQALRPKWDIRSHSLLPRLRHLCRRGGRKTVVQTRGSRWLLQSVFIIQQGNGTFEQYEFSLSVTAYSIRHVQAHVRQNSSMESGRWAWTSIITEKLLAFDICWEKESQFSLSMYSWQIDAPV